MVRVPGSFGDGGYHRGSEETAQVKEEPEEEVPTVVGSPSAPLNARFTDRQSPGGDLCRQEGGESGNRLGRKTFPSSPGPFGDPRSSEREFRSAGWGFDSESWWIFIHHRHAGLR
ncbi:hypothetical protein P3T76_003383 [Phytophthora citrophthora]|uniref:Uncharacterized protein n=1 Tax=Phytophthora citrophthora TaxID=4793 RepID=A0AAD9GUJ4_9STRA|nr:hypothetical protein P3T76_003383 [Phytophthora citrophthora]